MKSYISYNNVLKNREILPNGIILPNRKQSHGLSVDCPCDVRFGSGLGLDFFVDCAILIIAVTEQPLAFRGGWLFPYKGDLMAYESERWRCDVGAEAAICNSCRHYTGAGKCAAFPDGIPKELIVRREHDTPFPGDNGIRYEKGANLLTK